MRRFGMLPLMLLASLGSHPELQTDSIVVSTGDPPWWREFVLEMQRIGCINIRREPNGEYAFDCPQHQLDAAKRIVQRFKAKHA